MSPSLVWTSTAGLGILAAVAMFHAGDPTMPETAIAVVAVPPPLARPTSPAAAPVAPPAAAAAVAPPPPAAPVAIVEPPSVPAATPVAPSAVTDGGDRPAGTAPEPAPVVAATPAAPAEPVALRRLAPVIVEDAATVSAGRIRVRLPGVVPVGLDETCRAADGRDWPCGRRALAAIRGFVRGRAVECPLPKTASVGEFTGACAIGGSDLGRWAIENGWARAADGDPEAVAAMARARVAARGIHATSAPTPLRPEAEPVTGALPPDRTTAPLPGNDAEAALPTAATSAGPMVVRPLPPSSLPPAPPSPPVATAPPTAGGLEPMRLLP